MDDHPGDTLGQRIASFWFAIFMFVIFAIGSAVVYNLLTWGDPDLTAGAVTGEGGRVETIGKVVTAQSEALGKIGFLSDAPVSKSADDESPKMAGLTMPTEFVTATVAKLKSSKGTKSDKFVPGSPGHIEFMKSQAPPKPPESAKDSASSDATNGDTGTSAGAGTSGDAAPAERQLPW